MSTRRGPETTHSLEAGAMSPAGWIRSIIEILEDAPRTVDDVARELGQRFLSADEVPVDDYVSYLVTERLAEEAQDRQHFRLTDAGRTVLRGIIASPGQ